MSRAKLEEDMRTELDKGKASSTRSRRPARNTMLRKRKRNRSKLDFGYVFHCCFQLLRLM